MNERTVIYSVVFGDLPPRESKQQGTEMSDMQFTQHISAEDYDRQAVEYTAAMVEQLNDEVRQDPSLGSKSTFFQDPQNVKAGLPVFQGKHTRFVYDDDDEEIIAAVDITNETKPGPHVRTVADLASSGEEEEEDGEYDEEDETEEYEEGENAMGQDNSDDDMGVENEFYIAEDIETFSAMAPSDDAMAGLLEDVAMELASIELDSAQPTTRTS